MKYINLFFVVFILMCFFCVPIKAQSDFMSAIDEKINDAFSSFDDDSSKRFENFDKQVKKAHEEINKQVKKIWKEEKMLPKQKVWVGYDKDLKTRFVVDYENEKISVQAISKKANKKDLQKKLKDILSLSSKELDKKDLLQERVKKIEKPLEGYKKEDITNELKALLDEKRKEKYKERTLNTGEKIKTLEVSFSPNAKRITEERLKPFVFEYADKYGLSRALIFSIIKNESAFNPRARSHIPAYGLMQLVPSSGGYDAYSYILGKKAYPSPSFLYNPKNNIKLGTTYLYLLKNRYLKDIKDGISKRYCIISAYNTGAGNVARAFTKNQKNVKKATKIANKMSSKEVYERLVNSLPYEETRKYLYKVNRDIKRYKKYEKET